MNRFVKTLSLMAAVCLLLWVSACSGNQSSKPENSATPSSQRSGTAQDGSSAPDDGSWKLKKFDPPVTISTAFAIRDLDKLRNGDTYEDNPLTRWYRDNLGIQTKYQWLLTDQGDALNQKIRLAMASGEKLPDLLPISDNVLLNELIESGQIMSIDEAFEKYASPRTKEAYAKNPDVWMAVTKDGKRWGLPTISDGNIGDTIMWIRQDWLEAVNLPAPQTIEQFEALLEAFKQKYPDKIPLALSGKALQPLAGYMGDAQFVFGETQPYIWDKGEDGKLRYGSVQPGFKDGLAKLRQWFEQGYLGKEFATHDEQKAASLFTSGEAGIIFGPGWMGAWPLEDTAKNVPGAVVKPYELPSGVDGAVGRIGTKLVYITYVFRKDFEHMEALFQYYDVSMGGLLEDPNSPFAAGQGEGYDYVMVDGKPSWDVPGGAIDLRYTMATVGNTPPGMIEGPNIYERVVDGKRDTIYEQKLAFSSSPLFLEGRLVSFKQLDKARRDLFIGAPVKTMVSKWPLLTQMESEVTISYIYGKTSDAELDQFIQDWLSKGGQQITDEINEWYASAQ
ncbi:hypothetical protein B1A99_12040 [Cohnella sp. CIP 111063]|uniref:extracellular solute-binding protein n=1 Tax=unclassified Cohnella TaxID=2636738 RepID=UPI000B8BD620|nr:MULTISPECIES: extracellular solute-binding protein [unclassified Cohnella]OXS59341.1 hypothetical protein B1A99_12040 [Cohnella sp. CIP 111063]PRX72370.1 putative aldouronate transport system substrate-binding protein [Cohnella sp. SGD-V74]